MEFQQQEQTGISPGNPRQTNLHQGHPEDFGLQEEERLALLGNVMWPFEGMKWPFLKSRHVGKRPKRLRGRDVVAQPRCVV